MYVATEIRMRCSWRPGGLYCVSGNMRTCVRQRVECYWKFNAVVARPDKAAVKTGPRGSRSEVLSWYDAESSGMNVALTR